MAEKKMTEAAVLTLKVGLNPGAEAMGIGPGRHVVALQYFRSTATVVSSYVEYDRKRATIMP